MPGSMQFVRVATVSLFFGFGFGLLKRDEVVQARLLKRIGEICGSEAIAEDFGKGATTLSSVREGKVIVDVGFSIRGEEEEPIFLNW